MNLQTYPVFRNYSTKVDLQFLEIGLQTLSPNFYLENSFYKPLIKIRFYKNSMNPNRIIIYSIGNVSCAMN
jgi:hypothetical protein